MGKTLSVNSWDQKLKGACPTWFVILIGIGVMARFFCMAMGHNYDFESYQIVGDLVRNGKNVYAETTRYNYGFIFFLIQGLGYSITYHLPETVLTFRAYIVSVLTLADIGIALYVAKNFSLKASLFFFLNPISIVITGYHNQFDNIAVLLALISTLFVDEESEKITKRDGIAILFLTLSLITKHILYAFFIWLLVSKQAGNLFKRLAYACVPPALFLLSFLPWCSSQAARDGILNNVFLYRSYNNYPLLGRILSYVGIDNTQYFKVYILLMIIVGLLLRRMDYKKQIILYFAAMVAFSSSIANQYLIIPLVALCTIGSVAFYWIYTLCGFIYCVLNGNELHLLDKFDGHFPIFKPIFDRCASEGGALVTLMAWVLVAFLIWDYVQFRKSDPEKILDKNSKLGGLIDKYRDLIPYAVFGVLTTLVNILSYWICAHPLGLPVMASTIIAWVLAVLFAYVTNRKWVFHSEATGRNAILKEIILFFGARLATGVIDWASMFIFVDLIHFNDVLIKTLANILVIVLNYLASKLIIFKKKDEKP